MLPFAISPDAESYLKLKLYDHPDAEFVISFSTRFEIVDGDEALDAYSGDHFRFARFPHSCGMPRDCIFDLFGCRVFIDLEALRRLSGKTLDVIEKTVASRDREMTLNILVAR